MKVIPSIQDKSPLPVNDIGFTLDCLAVALVAFDGCDRKTKQKIVDEIYRMRQRLAKRAT